MDEFKGHCPTCNESKDIVSLTYDLSENESSSATVFACGHRLFAVELSAILGLEARLRSEHENSAEQLLHKYIERRGGESKRPARINFYFDHTSRKIRHTVEEQDPDGTWRLEHEDVKDFK